MSLISLASCGTDLFYAVAEECEVSTRPRIGFLPCERADEGFASLAPMHVLSKLAQIALAELEPDELASAISKRKPPVGEKVAVAPLFASILRFVQATFS